MIAPGQIRDKINQRRPNEVDQGLALDESKVQLTEMTYKIKQLLVDVLSSFAIKNILKSNYTLPFIFLKTEANYIYLTASLRPAIY